MPKYYTILIWLMLSAGQTSGSDYRPIDESTWADIVDGEKFEEIDEATPPKEVDISKIRHPPPWLKTLGYVLSICLLAVIIYLILRQRYTNSQKVKKIETLVRDLEERPMESDLDNMLATAIQAQEWRMAFRIHYLLVIRQLHEGGYIKWKKEKTNHDFIKEVKTETFYEPFRKVSHLFDHIWYGQLNLEQTEFIQHQAALNGLIHQITEQV